MSLLDEFFESCVFLEKHRIKDGAGGHIVTWTEGEKFECAITHDSSMLARKAESEGVSSTYTVTTKRNTVLEYPDVFKRLKDGTTFRVTSNGIDKLTPKSASLDMSQVSAERWELPT